MNETWWIWTLSFLGAAIGLAGALVGIYCSVRSTKGPRERALVIRASLLCCLLVLAFGAGVLLIPTWHRHLLWAPYAVLLLLLIGWCNRSQARIRQEESRPLAD